MFIKLQRSDGIPILVNTEHIDSIVYESSNTCLLYTNKCKFTLNISYDQFIENIIKLNIEIN